MSAGSLAPAAAATGRSDAVAGATGSVRGAAAWGAAVVWHPVRVVRIKLASAAAIVFFTPATTGKRDERPG
jgi:hypothetical protein